MRLSLVRVRVALFFVVETMDTDGGDGHENLVPSIGPVRSVDTRPYQCQALLQMVFDVMHGNGFLRNHVAAGAQLSTHVVENGVVVVDCSGYEGSGSGGGGGGGGGGHHVSTKHMAGANGGESWREPLLKHDVADDGLWDESKLEPRDGLSCASEVQISLPSPVRTEPKFPEEKSKTLMSLFFLLASWVLTVTSLAIVHERLPDRTKASPLPDVVFDLFPPQDWALNVSEVLIIVSLNMCLLVIFLHRHRYILLRRCFLILGVLYLMRSVTMFVTQVPVASTTYYCSPKANSTDPGIVVQRVLQLLSGFGLSINGHHTYCGDYIYSGHTVVLTFSYLVIQEYTPRRCVLLHWLSWTVSVTGVILVLLARGHYTVDVVIAYYVTTRVFWMYHTMANNPDMKVSGPTNYLSRLWWFCLFSYFEKNVRDKVPRQYEWPLRWPGRLSKRDRNS